jgi:ferrous iron transport protein B
VTTIALAGNPNCGKSALFNQLTGIRQRTGNWPGVTVDRKEGRFELDGSDITVIDLPGIYSFDALSLDEKITMDYLLSGDADLIINILDASNLERNLYLSMQIMEMGVPMILAINMMDVARRRGVMLDLDWLQDRIKCPIAPIVAISGEGLDELKRQISRVLQRAPDCSFQIVHENLVEEAIAELRPTLEAAGADKNVRWKALKLLEGEKIDRGEDSVALAEQVDRLRHSIAERSGEDADVHIADARFNHAHVIASQVVQQQGEAGRTLTDRIDRVVLGRWFGIPVFLAIMYLMFMFTINIGGAFIDFFDITAGAFFVDGVAYLMAQVGLPAWSIVLLADGVGGGLQVVATFIPIITSLYLFLSVLEDSGYMARAAFVMDRFMRSIGLPGKAFVPLIVGFGCNVPAVMATRTLDNPRERKLTVLMNPFMSCGARLPVYALFATAFFPTNGQNLVFGLYLIGIVVAVLTGLIMKRTLLAGTSTGFLMELPAYHVPTLRGVLLRTWDRVKLFMLEAGRVIVIMVLIINVLNSIGTDGSFGNENTENSVLSSISRTVTPVFEPMGIEEDNWPATVGVFTGVLAKEVVVGTLDALYTQIAIKDAGGSYEVPPFSLVGKLSEALATVPENLAEVVNRVLDPLGLDVGETTDAATAAEQQAVDISVFGTMTHYFDGQRGAFAYLLFILLYFPCVATIAAVARETGKAWAGFVAGWTTGVAYIVSTSYYQLATFSQHPVFSILWVISMTALVAVVVFALRIWSGRQDGHVAAVVGARP